MSHDRRPIVVLLVDDQPFIGAAVGRLLATEQDIELHCCERSAEAVERANQLCPTLILQDLVMPEIDGLALVGLYRANPKTAQTPVIVLSGNDDVEGRTRARAAGANDYLVKLPAKDDLLTCIRRHATGHPAAGPVADRPAPPGAPADAETLDQRALASLRQAGPADSSDFFVGLIDQFITEAESRVGMLKRAALGRDIAGLKTGAHSLKGTSNVMGAARLGALCKGLEEHLERRPDGSDALQLIADLDEEFDRVRAAFAAERRRVGSPDRL